MSFRTCLSVAGSLLALSACTSNPVVVADDQPPAPLQPAVDYGPAPAPSYLPRQTLRPGDRDLGRAPVAVANGFRRRDTIACPAHAPSGTNPMGPA